MTKVLIGIGQGLAIGVLVGLAMAIPMIGFMWLSDVIVDRWLWRKHGPGKGRFDGC